MGLQETKEPRPLGEAGEQRPIVNMAASSAMSTRLASRRQRGEPETRRSSVREVGPHRHSGEHGSRGAHRPGLEATAAIRAQERGTGTHVPIIAMTANAMQGDAEPCLAASMDAYISKPIRLGDLYKVIDKLLQGKLVPVHFRF